VLTSCLVSSDRSRVLRDASHIFSLAPVITVFQGNKLQSSRKFRKVHTIYIENSEVLRPSETPALRISVRWTYKIPPQGPTFWVRQVAFPRYLSCPVPGGITGLLSPQGDINSGDWPSRLGIGRNASDLTLEKLTATKSQTRIDGVTCPRKPKSTKGCSANGRRRLWRFAHSAGYMWMSAQGQEIGHNFLKNSYLHSIHHHLPHLIRRRITYEGHVVVT